MIPTLEEIQKRWLAACRGPKIERPSCFNRPAFVGMVYSQEFEIQYEFRQSRDCPQWKKGGNSSKLPFCDSAGGKKTPWSACGGCIWRKDVKK